MVCVNCKLSSFTANIISEMICRFTADLSLFGFFTRPTLTQFGDMLPFDTVPLYALMHEAIYARGYAFFFKNVELK